MSKRSDKVLLGDILDAVTQIETNSTSGMIGMLSAVVNL